MGAITTVNKLTNNYKEFRNATERKLSTEQNYVSFTFIKPGFPLFCLRQKYGLFKHLSETNFYCFGDWPVHCVTVTVNPDV